MAAVWRGLDQATLDAEVSPTTTVTPEELGEAMQVYGDLSAKAKAELPTRADVRYGPGEGEVLDFLSAGPGSALAITIHGGYFRRLSKDYFSYPALGLAPHGVSVASLSYGLAPSVPLAEMVRRCRAAVAFLYGRADELGFDKTRMAVIGHSAGGHLGGMLVCSGWESEFGLPEGVVGTALHISGIFDLEPIRLGAPQEWLNLSESDVENLSPLRLLPSRARLIITYGETDTKEFKRQSDELGELWQQSGGSVRKIDMPGTNHFNVTLKMTSPDSPLVTALVEWLC
ncbi:Alpha/Beta hydrolase protein [Hyaloraphidium curvatum]|nr:Alpha/Beta hydrolase protein [Hyaloraphidium curvatum]